MMAVLGWVREEIVGGGVERRKVWEGIGAGWDSEREELLSFRTKLSDLRCPSTKPTMLWRDVHKHSSIRPTLTRKI